MITYHCATTRYNWHTEPRYAKIIYQRVVHHENSLGMQMSDCQIIFRRCLRKQHGNQHWVLGGQTKNICYSIVGIYIHWGATQMVTKTPFGHGPLFGTTISAVKACGELAVLKTSLPELAGFLQGKWVIRCMLSWGVFWLERMDVRDDMRIRAKEAPRQMQSRAGFAKETALTADLFRRHTVSAQDARRSPPCPS